MNNNFEFFKNLTKEEINNNLEWGDPYEFGTQYAKYLLNEKQELIDYLKEQIKQCDNRIDFHKKEISGVINISDNNRHLILIKRNTVKKETYEEILSKIEKE